MHNVVWVLALTATVAFAGDACAGGACPVDPGSLAGPPEVKEVGETAGSAQQEQPRPKPVPAVPHVLVVHDSDTVVLKDVLEVFAKLQVTQQQAMPIIQRINEKGSCVVVEANEPACRKVSALFEAISSAPHPVSTHHTSGSYPRRHACLGSEDRGQTQAEVRCAVRV